MADSLDLTREAAAVAALREALGAATWNDEPLVADMIEGETSFMEALDALLLADLQDTAFANALADAKATLDGRRARIEARQSARRAAIERAMLIADVKKIERPGATLSLAQRKPAIEIEDEAAIPSGFFKTKPVLDKTALAEALNEGRAVPGARLSNGTVSLTVRRK
jgi:hypothetical protein